MEEKEITPEFYELLKKYTNSSDSLEDSNFDIVSYINERFPDIESLDKLDPLIEDLEKQIYDKDEEIDQLVCERSIYNEELKYFMSQLNEDVIEMIKSIKDIRKNTEINETTVKMICNDIKNLDNARNNITITISSLTK